MHKIYAGVPGADPNAYYRRHLDDIKRMELDDLEAHSRDRYKRARDAATSRLERLITKIDNDGKPSSAWTIPRDKPSKMTVAELMAYRPLRGESKNSVSNTKNFEMRTPKRVRSSKSISKVKSFKLTRSPEVEFKEAVKAPPNTPTRVKKFKSARQLFAGVAPTLPLVGIEPNPGPKSKGVKSKKKNMVVGKPKNRKRNLGGPMGLSLSSNSAPVAIGYQSVMKNKLRNTVVSHCEQIAEITAANAATYSLQVAAQINPGLASVFPWLSQVAAQYEAYEFKKLQFLFVPYVSSATAGYNAMNFDYNPQEESSTQFPPKQSFTDYDGSVQCNAWEGFKMDIKCPNLEGPRIRTIRTGALSGQYDLHNYDHGQFNFAVGASTGTSSIGTLYCCYSVALMRPRISSLGTGQNSLGFGCNISANKSHMLGTSSVLTATADSTLGGYSLQVGSLGVNNAIMLLSGSTLSLQYMLTNNAYLVTVEWIGTVLANITSDAVCLANNSAYTIIAQGVYGISQSATVMTSWAIVQMLGVANDQIAFNCGSVDFTGTTITQCYINVAQIPYGLSVNVRDKRFDKYIRGIVDREVKLLQDAKEATSNDEEKESVTPFFKVEEEDPISVAVKKQAEKFAALKISTKSK